VSKRDVELFVDDMIVAIDDITEALGDISFETFLAETIRRKAIIRDFQVLGEAATHIPPAVRKLSPDIPWRKIVAMRNALIHGYFLTELDIVFSTAKRDLPKLRQQLESLRACLDAGT